MHATSLDITRVKLKLNCVNMLLKKNLKKRLSSLLSLFLDVYAVPLRLKRSIGLGRNRNHSILIFPPYMPGSLGDEAVVTASVEHLKRKGVERIGLVSYNPALHWSHLVPITETIELCSYLQYGNWKGLLKFAHAVSQYEQFYCLGTDVLDGYYSSDGTLRRVKLVSLAVKTGTKAAILGFSFNNQPTPESVQALRDLPLNVRLSSRDPISQLRLMHHLHRPVELVADLAFLLHPIDDSEIVLSVAQWISEQHSGGRTVIGINANPMHISHLKVQSLEYLSQIYVDTLVELYSKNEEFSFVLIPHEIGDEIVLAEAILKDLPSKMQPNCIKLPTPCKAAEIKSICRHLDIVLSGRMHLAIACLGQGSPVACITYQGKFEGLFRHFDLDGMTIEPSQAFPSGNLVKFLMPLIEKREDISKHIHSKLPQIQQLAHANFG